MVIELQQLRETVQTQAQNFAEHSQELESERTALREELDRIAALEAKLGVTPNIAASSATLAANAAIGPATGVVATAPAPQAPQDFGKKLDALEAKLKNIGPFSFSGDFRLRDEPFIGGPTNQSQVRNRERYRARLYINAKLNDDFSGGLSFATGDTNDPITSNQTANQDFTRKPFLLDRAFVNYTPHQFKPFTLTGGKFAYPWYRTELTWDNDINPEGLAQKLEWKSDNWHVLRQFALLGFELPFSENVGVNNSFSFQTPTLTINRSIRQAVVYGGQIQTAWQLASWLKFTADTAFYNFHNANAIAFSASVANASSPAVGLLKLGGNTLQNSYQTVTASYTVPVTAGGTTTVNSAIVNAKFNSAFALSDSIAQFDIKTPSAAWPIRFLGDYVQNTRACAFANQAILVPTQPANATITTSTVNGACNRHQRRGYWLESRFGRVQEKGDWQFGYTRMFIEREAVLSNFDFSDIRQGSNVTQHRVDATYTAVKNVQLGFTGFFGRPLATTEPYLKRLQFDLIYKF